MTKKVFISYSHKDEEHREQLEVQLAMLKRNGLISIWHDRKILPGEEWKAQINENLESADIIIFLVSPDFLASDYCYDIEVNRAIAKQEEDRTSTIISIIIRPCDWTSTPFSKFQAVPTDGNPITLWSDTDSAWLDALKGITRFINEFSPKTTVLIEESKKDKFSQSDQILNWIEDTEITLTHRKVSQVKLSDVYVVPDMQIETKLNSELPNIKSTDEILKSPVRYIISGEEQQGKTSLLKFYFVELLKKSYLPIYLDCKNIKKSDIKIILKKSLEHQYIGLSSDEYLVQTKKVVLLDNFDEIQLNLRYKNIFLQNINEYFDFTILTCSSSFSYVSTEIPALEDYNFSKLLSLGNRKREEIIKKWISLGVEESIDETDLYSQCDEIKTRLNIVIRKNIVPAKPIYVLMLLQMFEANAQLNLELTSYGHCYQQLIYQSFEKANISTQDFDKYLNFLTELAWWIFKNEAAPNDVQLNNFFDTYCEIYLPVEKEPVLKKLTSHAILHKKGVTIGFKYPYIYYFFVGKKIAESYSDSDEVKQNVDTLLAGLHREDWLYVNRSG